MRLTPHCQAEVARPAAHLARLVAILATGPAIYFDQALLKTVLTCFHTLPAQVLKVVTNPVHQREILPHSAESTPDIQPQTALKTPTTPFQALVAKPIISCHLSPIHFTVTCQAFVSQATPTFTAVTIASTAAFT